MKFNLFKKKQPEKKSISNNYGFVPLQGGSLVEFALGYAGGVYNSLTDTQAMNFYRQSSAVATSVEKIACEVEQIKPVLRLQNGKFESSHEVLDRINNPNDFETGVEFIGALSRHYLITSNALTYAGGTIARPPVELYAVKPQNTSIVEGNDGYPHAFIVSQGKGVGNYAIEFKKKLGARYYQGNMKELYQTTGFSSTTKNIQGDSPLLAICMEITQQIQGKYHNISLLKNGARLTLFIQFKDSPDDDEMKSRRQFINEQLGGVGNAGKIGMVAASDADFKEFGTTNRDMDFNILDEAARNATYLKYKIPLPLVSQDASTFNNMAASIPLLYDWAVIPNYNTIFRGLSKMLLPRYGLDPAKVQITYNPEDIPALMKRRMEELKLRADLNIETGNELREGLKNREPLDGLDVVYQAANLVPAGMDVFTEKSITADKTEKTKDKIEVINILG
jgi:HK97 family phage portal protein